MAREFNPSAYPPFPDHLPTASLITISLSNLLGDDSSEANRLFEACKTEGFFYLNLKDTEAAPLVELSERLAGLAEDTFKIPQEEKDLCVPEPGTIFGYKKRGMTVTDKEGTPDTAEFFNISKNDMLSGSPTLRWPNSILDGKPLLETYIQTAHSTGMSIIHVLEKRLGLSASAITGKHRIAKSSGDHVRFIRGPSRVTHLPEIQTPSHTDFGTITILFNWLGGLQVWSKSSRGGETNVIEQESGEWLWVKPPKNHAIVNLGDAAVKFTNGVLRSGRHRVVPAPGEQGRYPRYSIVYFVRPEDDAILTQLHSDLIPEKEGIEEEITAKEWTMRQARALGGWKD